MSKNYVEITRGFFKKKDKNGDWHDVVDRPAITMATKWGKIKFSIENLDYVIDKLEKLRDDDYIYEEEE